MGVNEVISDLSMYRFSGPDHRDKEAVYKLLKLVKRTGEEQRYGCAQSSLTGCSIIAFFLLSMLLVMYLVSHEPQIAKYVVFLLVAAVTLYVVWYVSNVKILYQRQFNELKVSIDIQLKKIIGENVNSVSIFVESHSSCYYYDDKSNIIYALIRLNGPMILLKAIFDESKKLQSHQLRRYIPAKNGSYFID